MTIGYLGVLKELLNNIKYTSWGLAHMVADEEDEWKKAYAAFSLAKKSGKLTLDLLAKEKKFELFYENFVTRFVNYSNSLYTYYEKIAKGVDYTSMDIEYTGGSFLAENYIEKKDAAAFEFN